MMVTDSLAEVFEPWKIQLKERPSSSWMVSDLVAQRSFLFLRRPGLACLAPLRLRAGILQLLGRLELCFLTFV